MVCGRVASCRFFKRDLYTKHLYYFYVYLSPNAHAAIGQGSFAMRMPRSEKEVFAMWSLRIDSEVCRVCRDFGLWSRMLGVWESVRDLVSDLGSL